MTKDTFGELVVQGVDQWYRVAKTILKEDVDCEDAVSEAIVRGFAKIHTLKNDEYAKTWFTRILINECYTILRHKSKELEYDDRQLEQENQVEDYSDLYQNMIAIGDDYRIPLLLYYIEGFKIKEIAVMLDMKEDTVKARLSRGRKKLKSMFEQEASV